MGEVISNHPFPFEEPEKNLDGNERPGNGSRGIILLFQERKSISCCCCTSFQLESPPACKKE